MATLYSNELKAFVVPEDFLENPKNVLKENCLTIQHFDYECEHKRNASGEVYGPTEPVILKFTVRVNSPKHAKVFYNNLLVNNSSSYSFLFNATFDQRDRLKSYDDAMIVRGFVVDVKEDYDATVTEDGSVQQILIQVTLLLSSITYVSKDDKHQVLKITNN